jgi:hypothetical protein
MMPCPPVSCNDSLDTHVSDLSRSRRVDRRAKVRNERQKILQPIASGMQYNQRDSSCGNVLLMDQVAVNGYEHPESSREQLAQEIAIAATRPTLGGHVGNIKAGEFAAKASWYALIQEDATGQHSGGRRTRQQHLLREF